MNRSRVPIFKTTALALSILAALCAPAFAGSERVPEFWFAGTRLILDHPQLRDGEIAVANDDDGLSRLLVKLGASLAYAPERKRIVCYTADRRALTFALGDAHVASDGALKDIPFAPYADGNVAYVPFLALAHALGVAPVRDGPAIVLQPQLGAIDVGQADGTTLLTLHSATPIKFKRLSSPNDARLSLALLGVGTTLDPERSVGTEAVERISLAAGGTARNPTVVLDVDAAPGSAHLLDASPSANALVLAFANGSAPPGGRAIPDDGLSSTFVARTFVPPAPPPVLAAPSVDSNGPATRPTLTPSMAPSLPVPAAPPSSAPQAAPSQPAPNGATARLTAIDVTPSLAGTVVHLALGGTATYEWHRLPDNRWYVDLRGATLAIPARDDTVAVDGLTALRAKQFALAPQPVVRVALQLVSPRAVAVGSDPQGITLTVAPEQDPGVVRVGAGSFGPAGLVADATPAPSDPVATPTPADSLDTTDIGSGAGKSSPLAAVPAGAGSGLAAGSQLGGAGGMLAGTTTGEAPWKFAAPAGGALNEHLIVIDPGHGGSDAGSAHNGLTEKDLTLDMSKRLRDVLVARGWQVKLTRGDDRDVFAPNDSAHDELQARDDVANAAGARLFISIHVNAFTDSGLNGTTTYYYKKSDLPFAQAVHRRLIAALGTADDGVQKANYYVIHHANAPAALVETAFDSNPSDAALLANPAWRQKVARAIADGVADFVSNPPLPSDGT